MLARICSTRSVAGILGVGVFLLALGCTSSSDEGSKSTGAASLPDSVNTLTEAEREAGWKRLFNGSTLKGWRGFRRDSVPVGWTVEKGALHFTAEAPEEAGGPPQTLVTADTYDHFVLRIEWKISPKCNSGILYRVTEEEDLPFETGLEYQVLDNAALGEDEPAANQAGALFGLYAPDQDVTRTVGTYNETRIVVRGSHIEHWMNGTKLLEADIGSDTWNERVEGTKFANWPRFAQAETGHIALQDHGYPVWYRDIKLRSLPVDPE